jgi:hypothetical protein
MELQHIGAIEQLHTGDSEPVDAGLEGRMLGLGSVDERLGGRCAVSDSSVTG